MKSGEFRALAVTGKTRWPDFPDVPTVDETILPGFEVISWTGMAAPANLPKPIVDRLNAELRKALAVPEVKQQAQGDGRRSARHHAGRDEGAGVAPVRDLEEARDRGEPLDQLTALAVIPGVALKPRAKATNPESRAEGGQTARSDAFAGPPASLDCCDKTPPDDPEYAQETAHERAVKASSTIPFDAARLDRLMDEAGMDVLIATSKHNVQYLLGGHRAFFFDYMDAMGLSRYLPVLVYAKGAPDKAAYFGHRLENFQRENNPFWTPVQQCNNSGSVDTMQKAIEHIRKAGIKTRGIGAELSFLPVDAGKALQGAFPDSKITDCAVRAGADALDQDAGGIEEAQDRVGSGDRVDEGGDRQVTARARPRRS